MLSVQLLASRYEVHTFGFTEEGILYLDVQRFVPDGDDDAITHYVRASDIPYVKRRAFPTRSTPASDAELLDLFSASFHTVQYALDWLSWAGVPTVRRHDAPARYNAELFIPREALRPAAHLRPLPI